MKLWAKLVTENKIIKDEIFKFDKKLGRHSFEAALQEVTHSFDLSTPLILKCHYQHFSEFNTVKFKPADFLDEIGCDWLEVENI